MSDKVGRTTDAEFGSTRTFNGGLPKDWLGRQDSNLGMAVPKTAALPLGDAPSEAVPTRFGWVLQDKQELRKSVAEALERSHKRGYNAPHSDGNNAVPTPCRGLTEYSAAW